MNAARELCQSNQWELTCELTCGNCMHSIHCIGKIWNVDDTAMVHTGWVQLATLIVVVLLAIPLQCGCDEQLCPRAAGWDHSQPPPQKKKLEG
jgi:hypothetical protein